MALGGPAWQLVAGDIDGDSKADPMVYNPAAGGVWRGLISTMGYIEMEGEFGGPGYDAVTE
ncbi:MAG: hypothetical protein ABR497_09715 [Kiritimatiellia bacterium]|nr:hypothetical protein [Lentisphaerota bacterium]